MNDRFSGRCAAGGRGRWRFRVLTLALLAGLAGAPSLRALDEFSYDLRLARKLCEIEMFDYAARQVDGMQARYPKRRDEISLEQARVLFLNGKAAQAETLLGGITSASAAYSDSRLLLAEMAVRRGNHAQAKKAYAEYFAKNSAPASTDDDDIETFKKAVGSYVAILTQEGDGAGAAKVMDYLAKIAGDEGGMDERQIRFLKQQRILAAVEQQIQAGKKPDGNVINAVLVELDGQPNGLTWGRVDGLYAAALLETAHAQLLLNNPDKAIEKLKNGAEVLNAIEEEVKQESKTLDDSPMAGALYYYGAAQAVQAARIQGTDKAGAEKLFIQALKRLQKVRQQYANSPYASKATLQLAQVKQVLEKDFGRKISLGGEDAEVALRMQKAEVLYRAGRLNEALPLYLEAAAGARGSRNFPEIAQRLIDCYFTGGKYLEAEAVASYVAEAYPADPAAAETVLRLGGAFYKKAKEVGEKDKAAAAQLNDRAMEWWDLFVDLAPAGNASAPDVAFMVAEDYYGKAVAAAAKTKDMPEGKDKEAAKTVARALYLEAVPKYERLIAKFPVHERGVRALYKLGWIYYSAADQENPELKKERASKAAAAFQKYAAVEANTKLNDDVLEAKFRAGELLMLNGAAPEAIAQFSELVEWLKPGNTHEFDLNAAVTKRIREDAMVFLGWAYDYAGEASRPELEAIGARIEAAKRTIKAAERTREDGQAALKAAEAEQSQAKAEFTEDETNLRAPIGGTIVKTSSQLDQGAAGDQAQKALDAANDRERQKKMNAALLKSTRESLDGERSELARLRSVTQAARATAAERQAAAETRQKAVSGDLQKLAAQKERFTADLARATTRMTAARQAVAETAAEVKNQQTVLAAAKTAQKQARAAADKRRAGEARAKAARALQAATQAARAAQKELDETAGQRQVQLMASWANSLAVVSKQLLERQAERAAVERDLKQGVAESALQEARARRVALAVQRNALSAKLLEDGGVGAMNQSPERQGAVDAEVAALRDETDQRIAKAGLRISLVQADLAAAAAAASAAQADLQRAEADQAPLLAKLGEFRKLARAQFERYLAQFPQGRQAPDAMARIGTILLDERQFDAAAAVLNDLAGKYPNSKAVSKANFNLGRARMETNQPEEAAKAFERVLAQVATQPAGNLDYIADKMLAVGKPKLAWVAAMEMKRRGEDPKDPDYERLRPIRDGILLRAGSAALQSQRYADAIAALDTLLREKPNTFYYYDAKFQLAQARRSSQPPDYDGAIRDLSDILQVAVNDPVMTNRALVAMGEILALTPTRDSLQQAASRYQQVVLLADPAVAANRPLLEQAVAESAKLFSRLGDPVNRDKMVKKYQESWPAGRFIGDLGKLPPADFPPPPPPAATQ